MKYFMTVVECNSFTEAAEQCYISQSAISQQIQALEADLGVALIHRENRKFSLTPAGDYFYRHCRELLFTVDELREETVHIAEKTDLKFSIGHLRCYGGQEIHQAIALFAQMYPEVSIHVMNGDHEELYDLLRFGSIDLVLNDQRRAFSEEYSNYQLHYCDSYVEISLQNKLSKFEKLSLQELKKHTCILVSSKEQQENEKDFYQNTLSFGSRFLFAGSIEEARLMVLGNRGFLPLEGISNIQAPNPGIKRIPLYRNGCRIKRNYCAFWHKERENPYIEEFAQILKILSITKNDKPHSS